MIFAVTAVILVWSLIAHDLWVLSGSAMSGDDLGGGPGRASTCRPGCSYFSSACSSCLVWQAWRQLQQAGHESAAHVALQRLIVDHASEAMMLTDSAQRIVSVNAAFTAITGYREEDVLGKTPTRLSPDHHGLSGHRAIWDFVAENAGWEGEVWDRRKDGTLYPKQMRITAVCQDGAQVSHLSPCSPTSAKARRRRSGWITWPATIR
jgi:PAS domain S-box-containing protein